MWGGGGGVGGGVLVSVSEKKKKKHSSKLCTGTVHDLSSAGANPHLSHNQQMLSFSGSISKHLTKNKQKQIPLRTMFKK